jgi:hypothetical protein
VKRFGVLLLKCCVTSAVSSLAIWWAYSLNSRISEGILSLGTARRLTIEMAGIICFILLPVQGLPLVLRHKVSRLWVSISTLVMAVIVLLLYAGFVWEWREHWDISKGLSESAAFGPLVGHINAQFFSGYDGLSYIIGVVPVVAITVAIMTLLDWDWTANHQSKSPE